MTYEELVYLADETILKESQAKVKSLFNKLGRLKIHVEETGPEKYLEEFPRLQKSGFQVKNLGNTQ